MSHRSDSGHVLNGYWLATRGQSIGKWLLGIQIVDAETNELLSIRRFVVQRVIRVFLVMAIPGIGILLVLGISNVVLLRMSISSNRENGEKLTAMARATGLSRQTVYRVLRRCTVEPV